MVSTRGQRAKEDNETALATQLSLAEQQQQVSVSEQLQHELESAILSQQGDSRQDVSQQDVSQPIVSQQDISAEARVESDGNEPTSDSIIVEHPDDKSLLSVKHVQGIIKAEAREGSIVKPENTDAKLFNDLAIRLKSATSSVVKIDEDREPASLSSLPVSDAAGRNLISTSSEKRYSRVYSLRSRADEKERFDGLTGIAKSVGTNVKDDVDYHPPVSSRMRRQRKAGPSKATTKKRTHHSQLVAIGPSLKNGDYALQQHNIIQDTLETDVTVSQRPARARGRKVSGKSKPQRCIKSNKADIAVVPVWQEDYSINKAPKKKRGTTTRIDGVTLKIPLNPEDEEEFVPEKSEIIDEPKKYNLRVHPKKSGNKEVRSEKCCRPHAPLFVGDGDQSELTR
jgi:hypothetical protein